MEMQKHDHGAECEAIRTAMETRAALIYFFVKSAKDMGLDYLTLGRKAMFANGAYKAKTVFTQTSDIPEFSKQYMQPQTLEAFDGCVTVCNETCMQEESTYCPLVESWKKLTDDVGFLAELCDIAMCGDRGILSCYPDFDFALLGTFFDSDRCKVQVTKKER